MEELTTSSEKDAAQAPVYLVVFVVALIEFVDG